ncbi:hypothetical protein BDW22DRAFT_1358469, partial [Trametopsis cervina]
MPATRRNRTSKNKTASGGRYSTDIRVPCEYCSKEWDPRGLPRHRKFCRREREEEEYYAERRRQAVEEDIERALKLARRALRNNSALSDEQTPSAASSSASSADPPTPSQHPRPDENETSSDYLEVSNTSVEPPHLDLESQHPALERRAHRRRRVRAP